MSHLNLVVKSIWEILLEHLNRSKIKRLLRLYLITEGEIGNLKTREEDCKFIPHSFLYLNSENVLDCLVLIIEKSIFTFHFSE